MFYRRDEGLALIFSFKGVLCKYVKDFVAVKDLGRV